MSYKRKRKTYFGFIHYKKPIGKEYIFQELVNPIHNRKDNQVTVSLTVEYIDQQTKATQVSQFDLVLEKNGSNWKIIE